MAAAYAALLSIARPLHQILDLKQPIDPLHKEKIVPLYEKIDFIVTFLEDNSDKHHGTPDFVGSEIKNAAYEAQDFIDSYLCSISSSEANCDEGILDQDLTMAFERINFIWEEAMKMKNKDTTEDLESRTYISPVVDRPSTVKDTGNMVVGFDDDLIAIKERIYEDSDELQIISIVGMGGIGKTTLARRAYEDALIARHFDIYGWITLSAEYQRREIITGLLQSLKTADKEQFDESQTTENIHELFRGFEKPSEESSATLEKEVYQKLFGRRYLVVIDDIWGINAWDDLKMIFSDDCRGSRILLTTRLSDVAVHAGSSSNPLHQINLLNEDHSWKLLKERVFGKESCPLQLVEIGKKLAKSCWGLPLAIVAVAGLLLSSGNITKQELWENISENISSKEPTIALQCSKILCLSYDRLPLRLKPCFLYIAAFPEDLEINVSKLIKLWIAEGFLRPGDQSKCLEDVGEGYLEDLLSRSMILVSQKGTDGKLETVGIHDLLREICITKAEEEGFLHVSSKWNIQKDAIENPNRRISIHYTQTFQEWATQDSSIRSLLLFFKGDLGSELSTNSRHLSILDAHEATWPNFSDVISTFVNLRYLSFALNYTSCPNGFPVSISKLPNLETIIAHKTNFGGFEVPYQIWKMPKLMHLIMDAPFHLLYPSDIGIVHEKSGLQTLDTVSNFRFTEETIKILVNLRKLVVVFATLYDNCDGFSLKNLFHLQNLEELQVSVHNLFNDYEIWNHSYEIWNHSFPISLKKLILYGVSLPWENMTIVGSLPNLQVLQMMSMHVTSVSEWTPIEGQFLQLKYFHSSLDYLVEWEVEKEHFPSLESLILCHVWLDEIPCGIGEIDTLQLIELHECRNSLVISARLIQEQQHENGNDAFEVRVQRWDE